ncbi:putative adhesin [Streptomyces sp. NPDC059104]|uniref:putative adhesin n=1 Tax=Streptomyces sp. NPDC059104 TaxID=3346729 RepID=UPI0036866A06
MPTWICAHADYGSDQPKTFVPDGVSLHFYVREGRSLPHLMQVIALHESRVMLRDTAKETVPARSPVSNYFCEPLGADEFATVQGAFADESLVFTTPDRPVRLCEGDTSTCRDGVHTCPGLLGVHSGRPVDLHLVCCRIDRSVPDELQPTDWTLKGEREPETLHRISDAYARFMSLAKTDRHALYRELDDLPPASLSALRGNASIRAALELRSAEKVLDAEGRFGLARYLRSQPEAVRNAVERYPGSTLGRQYAHALREISAFGYLSDSRREAWYAELSAPDRRNACGLSAAVSVWVELYRPAFFTVEQLLGNPAELLARYERDAAVREVVDRSVRFLALVQGEYRRQSELAPVAAGHREESGVLTLTVEATEALYTHNLRAIGALLATDPAAGRGFLWFTCSASNPRLVVLGDREAGIDAVYPLINDDGEDSYLLYLPDTRTLRVVPPGRGAEEFLEVLSGLLDGHAGIEVEICTDADVER